MVVQEEWDISVPGCPMIRYPWHGGLDEGPLYTRQIIMTKEEYFAVDMDARLLSR